MTDQTLPRTVAFALCGSFCTLERALTQVRRLVGMGWEVLPLLSRSAATMDTRFGRAADWKRRLEEMTGHRPMETLQEVEPLGPKQMARALIVAPCTGTTMAKLAAGLSDTTVTLGAKSMLRGGRPVLLAPSTNDGLGGSAANIGRLLQQKHVFFVPFGQDDWLHKPNSLKSEFELLPQTLECALEGRQLQPMLLAPLVPNG